VPESPAFTSSVTDDALTAACREAGLDVGGASLLRFGENAIYGLAQQPLVVRIARSAAKMPRVDRELCVARKLRAADIPAAKVYEKIGQPLLINGFPVTFWELLDGVGHRPQPKDLAELLGRFHKLYGFGCELPDFKPLRDVGPRVETNAPAQDRAFLLARCRELEARYKDLEFALPKGPIHGDAHTGNLMCDRGTVCLLDFEMVGNGPREWDLMPTAIGLERFGMPEAGYRAFVDSYGFDVREWSGYGVLRDIRELTMTTWLMQNIGESPQIAAEYRLRVASLREKDLDRAWQAF
jgi:Ser/Thr protein kinase RdoA (MazF antagonist)